MRVSTVVYSYGLLHSRQEEIRKGFYWAQILLRCGLLPKHNKLTLYFWKNDQNTYLIQPEGKTLSIRPRPHHSMDRKALLRLLEKAVGEFFHADCSIFLSGEKMNVSLYTADPEAHLGIHIGDKISLGSWPQGRGGEEVPIQWRVLDISEEEALLISEKGLIRSGYCDKNKAYGNSWYLMWGNSLAREMCNGVFYHQLPDDLKRIIVPKKIDTVYLGPECRDKVFLLSEGQARLYLPKAEDRIAQPTEYLLADGVWTSEEYGSRNGSWWLLPQEDELQWAIPKAVENDGSIRFHSRLYAYDFYMIRPCISVRLSEELLRLAGR